MKKFLVLYRASTPAAEMIANTTPEQMQAGMAEWNRWSEKAAAAIIDLGSPLGAPGTVGAPSNGDMEITGFSILQADSLDAVKELLAAHPHLKTPGDSSITALEFLSMPGM